MKILNKNNTIILFTLIVLITASFVFVGISNFKKQYTTLSKDILLKEAIAHYDNMVNTRLWNAKYGGVYVLQNDDLKPNPYLKNNHMYSKDDELLIKINPAWMTKQISSIANKNGNYFYKITSLKPINPDNKPDSFEKEALTFFDKNKEEKFYSNLKNGNFNFMGSLTVKESCLKCHAQQGYKLGDIRGGLRISIPLGSYKENIDLIEHNSSLFIYLVIFFSVLSIAVVIYFVSSIYKKQDEIKILNDTLEDKVNNRTNALASMYKNEKYLKNVLQLVANVNEMLVQSNSFNAIAKNSIDRLIQHKEYQFIWMALYHNELLEIVYTSDENIIPNSSRINENMDKKLIDIAVQAIQTNSSIVYKVEEQDIEFHRRKNDLDVTFNICIPYKYNDIRGVISIYTDVESGFKKEEIKMLEQIVNDVSISMNAIAHKETILKMEDDKITNYEETILAFVNIIEQRDTYTAGHTIRVAQYCKLIAEELNLDENEIKKLEQAAILHDIGKVAIPDAVLLKPAKLSPLEYELIKYHSEAGYKMLLKIDMYKELALIIRYHHSRYDGKGYPKTESPDEIPFLSHIMIIADAFDAMTTNRIYKPRKEVKDAIEEIKKCAGTQFHPEIAKAAAKSLKNIEIQNTTQLPSNELEEKRFSYFFHDTLTGIYNESYLHPMLVKEQDTLKFLYHMQQHNFSSYNTKMGWEEGNNLIKKVATLLENELPTEDIFRFHGDDFIVLAKKEIEVKRIELLIKDFLKETDIVFEINIHKLDSSFNIKVLK